MQRQLPSAVENCAQRAHFLRVLDGGLCVLEPTASVLLHENFTAVLSHAWCWVAGSWHVHAAPCDVLLRI